MVYCASQNRRHHSWLIYGSLTCRIAPGSSWTWTKFPLDEFEQLVPPFSGGPRPMAVAPRWETSALPASFACTRTAPCRRQKIGCSSCSRISCGTASKWSRTLVRHGSGAKPISGFTCSPPALLAGPAHPRRLPPSRGLAQRLGGSEADAAAVVGSLRRSQPPSSPYPPPRQESPLLPMTGPNDALSAPKTLLNRPRKRAQEKDHTVDIIRIVIIESAQPQTTKGF